VILHVANGFITPPLLAVIGAPFSLLPFGLAIVVWNLVCTAAVIAGLRILGVRDRAFYILVCCSFPFVASLALGQPDGLFALAAALAWRYRDSWHGAVAVGALIAAKLFGWPLLIWLVATRRIRQAGWALLSSAALLGAGWALIGFKGFSTYPKLLSAEATAYEAKSHSLVSAYMRIGSSASVATGFAVITAIAVGAAVILVARNADLGWFTAALAVGVLSSPVMWQHYLVLLFVPLAITYRRPADPLVWGLVAALWLSPVESPPTIWQTWLIPMLASAIVIRTATAVRLTRLDPSYA
jgi:hypothetical protein